MGNRRFSFLSSSESIDRQGKSLQETSAHVVLQWKKQKNRFIRREEGKKPCQRRVRLSAM